jgi:choline dehydrogenase-like flavoprotein
VGFLIWNMNGFSSDQSLDVIIIGSGFGGSFAAYSLAKAGLKTLILEKGVWVKRDELDCCPLEIFVKKRYKGHSPILVKQYQSRNYQQIYRNEVVGGSSVFFGGAALRMRETDLEKWPIDYSSLEPYYTKAENLLEIYGEPGEDPNDPYRSKNCILKSIPLTQPAQRIYQAAYMLGYQPFKIPIAINFGDASRPICTGCNTCDGFPCIIKAKNDLTTTVLKKAQDFGLEILAGIIVKSLVEDKGEIKSVECLDKDTQESFHLSAKIVIVSGGAIQSPALLMRSNLQKYNHHRIVGKYLMRHCNAVVCSVFPYRTNPEKTFHKQVGVSVFYEDFRKRLHTSTGIIQDIYTPPRELIEHFAPHGLKRLCGSFSGYVQNLLCIAEDDSNIENSVSLSGEFDANKLPVIKIKHHFSSDDYLRRDYLIRRAKKILRKAGALAHYVHKLDTFSHAVGTVRFGTSSETSVLDKHCRFFGIKNLFVLDGSFFPTSAGVNPSLTISANSLRVAAYIISEFDQIMGRD